MEGAFAYIWEFKVKPDKLSQFIHIYGSEGGWIRLLRKGEGYLGTEFFRDSSDPYRCLTVDYWRSKEDRISFLDQFDVEYAELDQFCETLTQEENFLGDFQTNLNRFSKA